MSKISCKYCDTSLKIRKFTPGFEYSCPNCNGIVYRSSASSSAIIIMSFSTLIVFYWMITSDILSVTLIGTKSRSILDSIHILYQHHYILGSAILLTTIVIIPIAMIILINIIIFGNKFKISKTILRNSIKIYDMIKYWNMAEVYLIGILISMVKLKELTTMEINIGFWITLTYVVMFYLTLMWFNPHEIIGITEVKKKR